LILLRMGLLCCVPGVLMIAWGGWALWGLWGGGACILSFYELVVSLQSERRCCAQHAL